MRLTRLDDYQSWLVEVAGRRVAIDPWLTSEFSLPPGHWLFGRRRPAPTLGPSALGDVDALLLTAHFSDHLHPETLEALPKSIPVIGTSTAARLVRKLGFTNVRALGRGHTAELLPGLAVEAVAPGFPYSHNSNGYVLTASQRRLYLETHMIHPRRSPSIRGVDLLVAPVQSVRLLGIPFVMSPERVVELVRELAPKRLVPTGNDPQLAHGAFQSMALFSRGTIEGFSQLLKTSGLSTQFTALAARDSIEV